MIGQANAVRVLTGFGRFGTTIGISVKKVRFGVSNFEYIQWHELKRFLLECSLPPLSALLENDRIRETDSLVICIQLHSPVGPFFPQHPSAYYVPRDLLDGLEASLDNASTHATAPPVRH